MAAVWVPLLWPLARQFSRSVDHWISAVTSTADFERGIMAVKEPGVVEIEVEPDPDDGRATLLTVSEEAVRRLEEVADTLPAGLGRWLLATGWARACVLPFTRRGRVVKTSSLRGYLMLYLLASMRPLRRKSLRFENEQARIGEWLAAIVRLSAQHPPLALEVARLQRLVKGYGDTHARGWSHFQRLIGALPMLQANENGAQRLRDLAQAALADEDGQALDRLWASVRIDGAQPSV